MSQAVVEVCNVSRQFGATRALDDISLETPKACVHGLVGVNGAGKTTLIKHLLGLFKAKTGTVRVFGLDPVRHPVEVLGRIGYLSEERDMPEWMRIHELMWYTQAYHPGWDPAYAEELLKNFGLDPSKKIKDLSRGMRAQVGLIAAVAHRPDLLLLDEPSSGLDAVVRRDILNAIVRTVADDERTVLFSSHLLDEVEQLSDYVTMIQEGRVVLKGSLDEIKEQHHLLNIRLGASVTSPPVLDGTLSLEGDGRSWTAICANGLDRVREGVNRIGGEIVELRNASLQEIFIARVGRKYLPVQEG